MFLHCVLFSLDFYYSYSRRHWQFTYVDDKDWCRLPNDTLPLLWSPLRLLTDIHVPETVLGTRSSQDLLFIFRDKISTRGTGIGADLCTAYCIELNWCRACFLLCLLGIPSFIKPSLRSNESSFPLTEVSKKLPLLIKMHISWFSGKLLKWLLRDVRF